MSTTTNRPLATSAIGAREQPRLNVRSIVLYAVTTALAVMFIFPLFWAVMSALKTPADMYAFPPVIVPAHPRPYNFVDAFTDFPFATWYQNTLEVVLLATLGTVASACL